MFRFGPLVALRAAGLCQICGCLRTGSAGHLSQKGSAMAKLFDVIVAGGGPAGLEAARTAARYGLSVALVERKTHPALLMRSCPRCF